jgi:rhamnosyl/mannosyltransferase
LLEAAKIVETDIVIVGEGPLMLPLISYAKQQNLNNVHFAGALSDNDKTALLDLCIGLVFPSDLRSEAFGLSLVEASMFSKPMISCEIGTGTSFVNKNGETGLVVPPQNPYELSVAMKTIAFNADLAKIFGSNARKRYNEKFTAKRMTNSYVSNYFSLLK